MDSCWLGTLSLPDPPLHLHRSCGAWDDSLVARANHAFLTRLFNGALKPYLGRDLYLVGESYAGVYVPVIARELLADPQGIALAGMVVGDGCLGSQVLCGLAQEPHWQLEFLHGETKAVPETSPHQPDLQV